ncbi:hypothetical protein [Streptomyces sp. NPDC008137]|uniref:hypothetical protein n=1 Tax=Streptomyces sp. NPDC008137 TaxID=3364813 RepID=UPI0036EF5B1C
MATTSPTRRPRRLLCLFSAVLLLSSCQGGRGDDRPGPDTAGAQWRQIPLADLPSAFFGLSGTALVAAKDGFLLAARPQGGNAQLYRSTDGIAWRQSRPPTEQMSVRVMAEYEGDVIAAGSLFRDGETFPAAMRYREKGRWAKAEQLPKADSSDVVLAAARGPHGTVVVGHDGGPFEPATDQKKGRSLRVWTATDTGAFAVPHDVACPQWPDQAPEVAALADEGGFTVWAKCTDPWGTSASFTLHSTDGATWRRQAGPPRPLALRAGTAGPSGGAEGEARTVSHVVAVRGGFLAMGSAETSTSSTGALWSSADGRSWTRSTGGKDGFRQSVRVDSAAQYGGTLLAFGTDPEPDGHPPARTRVWIGTPEGRAPKPIPTKGEGLQAVTGTWTWAQGSLKITAQGEFTYRYRLLRDCATEAPPCDDQATSTWGGVVTGTLTEEPRGALRGKVLTSNTPERGHTPGDAVTVARVPYGAVGLTIGDSVVGIFCTPGSYDNRCTDVHG